jgi:hypothetical protein
MESSVISNILSPLTVNFLNGLHNPFAEYLVGNELFFSLLHNEPYWDTRKKISDLYAQIIRYCYSRDGDVSSS